MIASGANSTLPSTRLDGVSMALARGDGNKRAVVAAVVVAAVVIVIPQQAQMDLHNPSRRLTQICGGCKRRSTSPCALWESLQIPNKKKNRGNHTDRFIFLPSD